MAKEEKNKNKKKVSEELTTEKVRQNQKRKGF